jgi:hypothetical protein
MQSEEQQTTQWQKEKVQKGQTTSLRLITRLHLSQGPGWFNELSSWIT